LITLGEFKPATGAYQSVPSYFTAHEREAYAWLAERAQGGRLWDVADRPRDMYLRTYALSEVSLPRYMGYYDNGAPLYTWEQMNWGDLLTSLRLHDVRYVLLRKDEPRTPELGALLGGAGYQVAFENAQMLLWEDSVPGGYVRFYPTVALDSLDDRERSREALAALYRRGVATAAADSLPVQASPSVAESLRFDYALISRAGQSLMPSYLAQPRSSITLAELDAIEAQAWGEVDVHVWRPAYGDIRLEVAATAGGLLTIAESWYPYWCVEIDGRSAPVLRANGALLGVMLSPGQHQIRFYYARPAYVYIGFGITALTLLCLIGYGVVSRRSRAVDRL
jgi:hypothetical protein